ncbi:ATP-dependent Clp protease proteolytic subunit [Lyngbya confervoides]|uniref:ATP-dependent Clp protease proteolytic subunit n=1 Tax=Lyngbya confervoides BDU141951 TaxID=1574623 RepID=A0ABD4T8H4_9CYAN|nr:ATP-dependent Clp protease proteolytic subunit [Lyngbya confervoides]MCM1985038.1 ATP-dependent Clp protease proteolytic subunit [Lyngbya confervoides BDU141951]
MPVDEVLRVPYQLPGSQAWQWINIYTRLSQERIIFLNQPLTMGVANSLISALLYLDSQDPEKPIYLYINSYGDPVAMGLADESAGMMAITACLSIYDTMQHIRSPIITIALGQCIGLATLLLSSGEKGKRGCLPHTELGLVHSYAGIQGQATDIQMTADEMLKKRGLMLEILARNTGQSSEKIAQDMQRSFSLTPENARDYGLIDHVLGGLGESNPG